ncbi:MAG: exodeoxyribonuclease VII large subunit, partial [Staphylococcus aureus]|nr:exodeoxyribonuclease VII large subunit [Staphylococcus aureus]
ATPDQYELLQQIQQYQFTLTRFIKKHLEQQRKHVEHLSSYSKFKQPTLLYDQQIQRRDDLEKRLKQQIQATFEQQRHRLMLLQQRYNLKALLSSVNQEQQNNLQLTNQLVKLLNSKILSYKNDLKNKVENLNNLSPTNTMLRGYAIVNKKDEVITSTKDLTENDQLTLTMKDGLVDAKVTKVRCNND